MNKVIKRKIKLKDLSIVNPLFMLNYFKLNKRVIDNYKSVKYHTLIPPFLLLGLIYMYFKSVSKGGHFAHEYIHFQKELFYYLNHHLSKLSTLQINITQLGDALIFFTFISVFIIFARKFWESLLISSILSAVVSYTLKNYFDVPRPVKVLDIDSFVIIGEPHFGYSSFPSGHSIATFMVIATVLFAFMPKKISHKIIWSTSILSLGLIVAFSRVGVGAHYPFDVIIGSIIGYIVTIIGIIISNKLKRFSWSKNHKAYYIFLMIILPIWMFLIVEKILKNNLFIFYLAIISLIFTLYIAIRLYVIKKN